VNKSDVLDRVAETADVGRQQVERVLDAFFDTVKSAVKRGDRVGWPSFGAFSSTQRKARTGRNPRTGAPVKIRASKAVKFSSSSALKDHMNSAGSAKKAAPAKKAAAKKGASARKTAPAKKAPAKKASAKKASPAKKAPAKKAGRTR
jgi:DNA-binding protein HU-beta